MREGKNINVVDLSSQACRHLNPDGSPATCSDGLACPNFNTCLNKRLLGGDMRSLRRFGGRLLTVSKNGILTHAGRAPSALYVIRRGWVKLTITSASGHEQIVGFRGPGEAIGIVSLLTADHPNDTIALSRCEFWEIPAAQATEHLTYSLQQETLAVMARRIYDEQKQLWRRNNTSATQRVGAFMLDLATRRTTRIGTSKNTSLELGMSRADLANYLGMTVESLSRALGALQQDQLIEVHGRNIVLLDFSALAERSDWLVPQYD